jgi:hypothetical protein
MDFFMLFFMAFFMAFFIERRIAMVGSCLFLFRKNETEKRCLVQRILIFGGVRRAAAARKIKIRTRSAKKFEKLRTVSAAADASATMQARSYFELNGRPSTDPDEPVPDSNEQKMRQPDARVDYTTPPRMIIASSIAKCRH